MTETPPPARADDKDWTWVLDRPCPECGADVGLLTVSEVARLNRSCAEEWARVLTESRGVHERPGPDVWSPLEYGCHVRDVFQLFAERLDLMLSHDDPMFANWDPNKTAEAERYDLSVPEDVAVDLVSAATALADRFAELSPEQSRRPGRRSDGASFTVETFARYEIHDPLHHLWDVIGRTIS